MCCTTMDKSRYLFLSWNLMKSPFDKSTESTRRFDALSVNKVLRYFYDMCQKSRFKKTNDVLQTFTLTSVYVCDKDQCISLKTQITFRALLVLIITTVFYHIMILAKWFLIPEMNLYVVVLFKTVLAFFVFNFLFIVNQIDK